MAQMKAKEREIKAEKEAHRQVSGPRHELHVALGLTLSAATNRHHPREACQEGGEGAVREDGRDDAPEASRAVEAQGEAEQALEFLKRPISDVGNCCQASMATFRQHSFGLAQRDTTAGLEMGFGMDT